MLEEEGKYKAYVAKNVYLALNEGISLSIDAMNGENLKFTILSVTEEPDYYVIHMEPEAQHIVKKAFNGNTKLSGYVYTHKIRTGSSKACHRMRG